MIIEMTKQEVENLLVFLTGANRLSLTGNEAFEFVNIVNKISNAKEKELFNGDVAEEPQQNE